MPFNPDLAALLARGLLGVMTTAEQSILRVIASQLADGIDRDDWVDRHATKVARIRRGVAAIMRDARTVGLRGLATDLLTAYRDGAQSAADDLDGGPKVQANAARIAPLVRAAQKELASTVLRTQSSAAAIYRAVADDTTARMLRGELTRREASAAAVRQWADRGVTAFIDKGGRRWEMGAYAEMVARTAAMQALVAGHVDHLQAAGHDLVMVSDAPEECQLCRPWEGTVLSLTGDTPKYATLQQAKAAGLFHPSCRHRLVVYIPGVTERYTDTRDEAGDKLRQQQRAYERRVRELARRVETLRTLDPKGAAAKAAQAVLVAKQREFKAWRAANDRKALPYRTDLVSR